MSEQEDSNTGQTAEKAEVSVPSQGKPASAVTTSEPSAGNNTTAAKAPGAAPRKGSSIIAWLALLLALGLAGAAALSVLELQRREAVLVDRLVELEGAVGQEENALQALDARWQSQLQSGLGKLQGDLGGKSSRQAEALAVLTSQLAEQRTELARFSANDRDSWLLAETEYLLRLANQRLIMAGDVAAAQSLLSSADNILREMDDVGLHPVRAAVAADVAAVRAVPTVDIEGIYLRLSALSEQAGRLVIFQLPKREAQPAPVEAVDWKGRLRQGYEAALAKLSDYVAIRRRDVPMQTLMDPQWEGLVRQNLRMLLEQSQVALLSGNQALYTESLQRAQHWVAEFIASDEAASRAMAREITQLTTMQVAVAKPDISRSLQALNAVMEQRLQHGGDE
ncbi:MAG: uroporphyrinogen-III C-methyltransferase [Halioglobus sp.]